MGSEVTDNTKLTPPATSSQLNYCSQTPTAPRDYRHQLTNRQDVGRRIMFLRRGAETEGSYVQNKT